MGDLFPLALSLRVATAATLVALALGVPAAWLLARRRFVGRGAVELLVLLPMVLPPTVVGYYLLLLLGRRTPLGQLIEQLTGGPLVFTPAAAVLATTVAAAPFLVRAAQGGFEGVDPAYEEVARTLGRSELAVFLTVTVPLAGRGIAAGTALCFARAMGEFGATLMLAGNIPGRTQTASLAVYDAFQAGDDARAALLAVLLSPRRPRRALAAYARGAAAGVPVTAAPATAAPSTAAFARGVPGPDPASPLLIEVDVRAHVRDSNRGSGGFTLDVAFATSGGITALVGPSGAGKTLTLRAVAGLLRPAAGRIASGGRVLYDRGAGVDLPARERRVGYVVQQHALFPHLTAGENVAYGLPGSRRGWLDRSVRATQRTRVVELLALVELPGVADRRPRELSGGQQQRVALARALASDPALLLLDEPLAAADAPLRTRLGAMLRALHERTGVPMLLVTHDPAEADRLADIVVRLDGGGVVATEPRAAGAAPRLVTG